MKEEDKNSTLIDAHNFSEEPTICCPICFVKFPKDKIQSHAENCGSNPFILDEGDLTMAYDDEGMDENEKETTSPTQTSLEELIAQQVSSDTQIL